MLSGGTHCNGIILLVTLLLLTLLSSSIIWSAGLQIQQMKVLNLTISRLHLETVQDRNLTEIIGVLSKNASLWFNQNCVLGYCTVPFDQQPEHTDLLIEREVRDQVVWLRITLGEHFLKRLLLLRCTTMGCERWAYKRVEDE